MSLTAKGLCRRDGNKVLRDVWEGEGWTVTRLLVKHIKLATGWMTVCAKRSHFTRNSTYTVRAASKVAAESHGIAAAAAAAAISRVRLKI